MTLLRWTIHLALGTALALLLVVACGCAATRCPGDARRTPNVLLIVADDLGFGDLSCYGSTLNATPNIDRLAREGVRLTDFYVSQPVCSASRASFLTGCYANRVGISGALGPASRIGLSNQETTIAGALHARGYATAIFGKWHLGHLPGMLPDAHGFGEFEGIPYSNDMWPRHPEHPEAYPDLPMLRSDAAGLRVENPRIEPRDQREFTSRFTQDAVEFIHRHRAAPFFVYLAHPMPHVPIFAGEGFDSGGAGRRYSDVIAEIDWSVGEVMAAVEREGLASNTIIIFSSDNGPWLSYGNHAGSAGPLREGKGTTWEGGVRVPCVIRYPGHFGGERARSFPCMSIDVLPTICEWTEAPLPLRKIDGRSLVPFLEEREGPREQVHEALFFYYQKNDLEAMRAGDWKLVFPHRFATLGDRSAGVDGTPGTYSQVACGLQLFNLREDLGEQVDLAARRPEVVARLTALAEQMRGDLGDNLTGRSPTGSREPARADAAPGSAGSR